MALRAEQLEQRVILPHEVPVYGWERKKDPRIVWAIIQSIRRGIQIPAGFAMPRDDGSFDLDSNWTDHTKGFLVIDGGYNRAVACAIEAAPFNIRVTDGNQRHKRRRLPVVDITFKEQRSEFKLYRRRHPWADFSEPDLEYMTQRLAEVHSELFGAGGLQPDDVPPTPFNPETTLDI